MLIISGKDGFNSILNNRELMFAIARQKVLFFIQQTLLPITCIQRRMPLRAKVFALFLSRGLTKIVSMTHILGLSFPKRLCLSQKNSDITKNHITICALRHNKYTNNPYPLLYAIYMPRPFPHYNQLTACKIAHLAKAPSANLHICCAPDPRGEPLLRRSLRQGYLQTVSNCPDKPSKQKPSSGSKALLFVRPAAGAPRRLRQRYASILVERFAHDRAAVLVVRIVVLRSRAFCTRRGVCGRRLRLVNLIYSNGIPAVFVISLHGEMTVFIKMILLGDETVQCLATILPGPALSSSHSGPLVWVALA